MDPCEHLPGCIFFNDRMQGMPALAEFYKRSFCLGNPERCARRMVLDALGRGAVPDNLFPNQRERALELIGR